MNKVIIKLEITSCKECPHFDTKNQWSSDGWDRMEDWFCNKVKKTIASSVEWHEESRIEVPEFCPCKI
jgi:hypothetical protein